MSVIFALLNLIAAIGIGTAIGLERTYRGRAAGARTYALVCSGSALLMVMFNWPDMWVVPGTHNLNGLDPTRVVQGILTGIGFLGAGVIVRDGYSVRGLTTAASIWSTAAIGIVVGNGFIVPGILFAIATLAILSFMKRLEDSVTAQHHIRCQVSCPTGGLTEEALRVLLSEHHFKVKEMAYDMSREKQECRYSADVWAHGKKHAHTLAATLKARDDINSFQIVPSRD